MQQNITVIDEEYKTMLEGGCKKAKMGEAKVINIRKYSQQLLSQASREESNVEIPSVKPQVETPVNPAVSQLNQVEPENKVIQFPSKETFEARLNKVNVSCYQNFPGAVIKSIAARRLRTASIVPETLIQATSVAGVENVVEVKKEFNEEVENENKIIQFPSKEKFDFGQLVNQTTPTQVETENKIIQFPSKETKQMPNIDDYFKKEVEYQKEEQEVDNTSIELQNARNNYENILESYKTQCEIQERLERELQELRQQRVIKIEEYRQKTLEETQNLNDVLTKINQLKDEIDEERRALGLIEEDYKKAI